MRKFFLILMTLFLTAGIPAVHAENSEDTPRDEAEPEDEDEPECD